MISKSEFNEDEFQSAVYAFYAKFLMNESNYDFHIPTRRKEKDLGYDFGKLTGIPFYMQFKVVEYHNSTNKKYENDRKLFKYNDQRGFYLFQLHRNAKTKTHIQHNALYNLNVNNFYVSPKFVKKNRFYNFLDCCTNSFYCNHYTNNYRRIIFNNNKINHSFYYPFLDDVIYIKPHNIITDTSLHSYTYNDFDEVAFHSEPIKINERYDTFEILNKTLNNSAEYEQKMSEIINNMRNVIIETFSKSELKLDKYYFSNFCELNDIEFKHEKSEIKDYFDSLEANPYNSFLLSLNILNDYFDIKLSLIGLR